jgi:oxazoline/thiazoline dehydrogenase
MSGLTVDAAEAHEAGQERLSYCLCPDVSITLSADAKVAEVVSESGRIRLPASMIAPLLLPFLTPRALQDVIELAVPSQRGVLERALLHAIAMGVLCVSTDVDRQGRDVPQRLEAHDRVFHRRSRGQIAGTSSGATQRGKAWTATEPTIPVVCAIRAVALPIPSDTKRMATSLCDAITRRASAYGTTVVSRTALAELLYWGIRHHESGGRTSHPYPSGGALYAIETIVQICSPSDLRAGFYWYNRSAHTLEEMYSSPAAQKCSIDAASIATGGNVTCPAVLLHAVALANRVVWKYESIAYSLLLKETGAWMQSIALVACALGMTSCPLGSGASRVIEQLVAQSFSADASVVLSVGEILIGGGSHTAVTDLVS